MCTAQKKCTVNTLDILVKCQFCQLRSACPHSIALSSWSKAKENGIILVLHAECGNPSSLWPQAWLQPSHYIHKVHWCASFLISPSLISVCKRKGRGDWLISRVMQTILLLPSTPTENSSKGFYLFCFKICFPSVRLYKHKENTYVMLILRTSCEFRDLGTSG